MLKIGFYVDRFSFRGTEQAIFDYAQGAEKYLNGVSYILNWTQTEESTPLNNIYSLEGFLEEARQRFVESFGNRVISYSTEEELKTIVSKLDMLYVIIGGSPLESETPCSPCHMTKYLMVNHLPDMFFSCPVAYHFVYWPSDVARGAAVGGSVSCRNEHERKMPCEILPHIVRPWPEETQNTQELRTRMREYLGIPPSAVVVGRLGGIDTLNIDFVPDSIQIALDSRPDLFFIFASSPLCIIQTDLAFHPRIMFVQPTVDDIKRCALIDACDYMIHGSSRGETFGLAVLEFLSRGKPVISFLPQSEQESYGDANRYHRINSDYFANQHLIHLMYAPAGMFRPYVDRKTLENILSNIKIKSHKPFWFHNYTPEEVMQKFAQVFGINRLNPKSKIDLH